MISTIISTYNHKKHVKSVLIQNLDTNCFNDSNNLVLNEISKTNQILKGSINNRTIKLVYRFEIDHYVLFLFLITLNQSKELYQKFLEQFNSLKCNQLIIKYKLADTPSYPIQKAWNYKIIKLYIDKMKLEISFSWLSTLGGACSTLGDKYKNFAYKAAIISNDQLKISLRSGDPYTICRCLIYNVYSLIQRDRMNCAFKLLKRIVYPYILKNFGNKKEREEYLILKGMYISARDNYYFKRNYLKKLAFCGKNKVNGLRKRTVLSKVPIFVS